MVRHLDKRASWSRMRSFERVLFLVAFLSFGYVGAVALDRVDFQRIESARLAEFTPTAPSPQTVQKRPFEAGDVIGRLSIPTAKVDSIVAEGVDARTLRRAVGHIPNTALPGEPGNVALAGHRDTFFRGLDRLHLGDPIRLVTSTGTYLYRVEDLRIVEPNETWVLAPGPAPTLTLVTCYPFHYLGSAPQRYIIRAREVGRPVTARSRPAAQVDPP